MSNVEAHPGAVVHYTTPVGNLWAGAYSPALMYRLVGGEYASQYAFLSHKIGTRNLCQPAWCAVPVFLCETTALIYEFSRQRSSSRSRTRGYSPFSPRYVLVLHESTESLKAGGMKAREGCIEDSRGRRGCL